LSNSGEDKDASCHEQRKDSGMCAAKALHRFLLYGVGGEKVPFGSRARGSQNEEVPIVLV
jgi:hypothetical protein